MPLCLDQSNGFYSVRDIVACSNRKCILRLNLIQQNLKGDKFKNKSTNGGKRGKGNFLIYFGY